MHPDEFAFILLWILLPPFLIGLALLALLPLRRRPRGWRLVTAALVLLLFSGLAALLLVAFVPGEIGRYVGIHDIKLLGVRTMWAPFAFIAVALAFPVALWWGMRETRHEP